MTRLTSLDSARQLAPVSATNALLHLGRELSACADLRSVLAVLSDALPALLPARDRVSIALLEPDGEWLRFYRLLPPLEELPETLPRVRVSGTVVGKVATDGVAQVVDDVRSDRNITFGHASHDGIRSTASVPVRALGRVVGVFNVGSRRVGACHEGMIAELEDIAMVLGPAFVALEAPAAPPFSAPHSRLVHEPADGLIGTSSAFKALLAQARRAAAADVTVLITGETGVGKTALARTIHGWSPRSTGAFVPVHLADLQPTLIESELFGHERGAFTGAANRRQGRFELADGGTVFLDEIGETPLPVQAKLLRVVQDGCFERVGGDVTLTTNTRLIAATHCDLHDAARRGEFRRDLLYRLEVVPLHVPPLRERQDDLETLATAFLQRLTRRFGRELRLSPSGWRRLRTHGWPGNIRELESILTRASVLEDGPNLDLISLDDARPSAWVGGFAARAVAPAEVDPEIDADWPTSEEHERRYLVRVLGHTAGRIEGARGAARLLDLQPSTLRSRMKKLGVVAPNVRAGRS
ncbi:MAG: sigma-54-dependent Fis family transcriptional regulator [Myxococcales bacterium]|nr:sigma-54-dependent Fis family transcriptional regulator [Myxococcales bacterium]